MNRNIKKQAGAIVLLLCIIVITAFLYVYKNVPLRTAIYRSIAKQSVYLVSEKDTLYNFGYFGVRKLLVNRKDGSTTLLKENSDFTHNCFVGHLIGRSGAIKGNFLYVAARSYIGGRYKTDDKNYLKGELLIIRKSDMQTIKQIPMDYSMIEAKIHGNILAVTGLQGFNIYDISNPTTPRVIYSYRTDKTEEYQGCDFFEKGDSLYLAIARFNAGLSIYRINSSLVSKVMDIPIAGTPSSSGILQGGMHVFRLLVKYPYIIATLGPTKENIGSTKDNRGIIVYNLTDLNNIKRQAVLVPKQYYYSKVTGDPQPSHIATYRDKIYVNFCEKGVAVFTTPSSKNQARFLTVQNDFDNKMILPLYIDKKGMMYAGSFDNKDVYTHKLK